MNRFTGKPENKNKISRILSLVLLLAAAALLVYGSVSASSSEDRQSLTTLETALNRDIIHCYATTGAYPESLSYIEEHYALTYDREKYTIDYQPIAKNIMPEVSVIENGGA